MGDRLKDSVVDVEGSDQVEDLGRQKWYGRNVRGMRNEERALIARDEGVA